ncbi:MAG: UbiD family decarboxylase [Anaerolineales bacterium]
MAQKRDPLFSTDLREWIRAVDEMGELRVVEGADWNLELGAISELNCRLKPTPTLLFDKIKDYPAGFRILTASTASRRRLLLTLRMAGDLDDRALAEALVGKPNTWEQQSDRFAPKFVSDGPILENVIDSNINLESFPTPFWHSEDGGRFIGTGSAIITSDPDSGWINIGAYRMMTLGGREVSLAITKGKHGRQHYEKWWQREGRCPVLASLGHDPLFLILAGLEVPTGISEYNYGGVIIGEPIQVIREEITGLPMPAFAEIVLAGWIRPEHLANEGPFGEATGYYSATATPVPAMEVERVYYRNDPIVLGAPTAKPPHDYSYMRSVLKSAMIFDALVKAGIPDVCSVWAPECAAGRMIIVVSIKQRYFGHSRQAGYIASQCQTGAYLNRYVIVVDDDIDPSDMDEVMWAVATRSDPATDIDFMRKSWSGPIDPLVRDRRIGYNSRAIIDACRPFEWIDEFPHVAEADPAYLREIKAKWPSVFEGR